MDVKKTIKWDGKLKGLHFQGNELIDDNGEIIDLNYGEGEFFVLYMDGRFYPITIDKNATSEFNKKSAQVEAAQNVGMGYYYRSPEDVWKDYNK